MENKSLKRLVEIHERYKQTGDEELSFKDYLRMVEMLIDFYKEKVKI